MTTTIIELLVKGQDRAAGIDKALAKNKLARGIPGVGTGIAGLLGMPIGNLALFAYSKYQPIEEAKRETKGKPGTRRVVPLTEHTIQSTVHPTVEVEVEGVKRPVLELDLKAKIKVESAAVAVEDGKITGLAPGSAKASVTLSAGDVELASAKLQPVELGRLREAEPVIDLTLMEEETVLEV